MKERWLGRALGASQCLCAGACLLCLGTAAALAIDQAAVPPTAELWSEERLEAWHASAAVAGPRATGVLAIAAVGLEAPVFPDDGDWSLNRGLGVIDGTDVMGLGGNVGIAGHRDGFFRALKDVAVGDRITLRLGGKERRYVIEDTHVVSPEDTWVLEYVADGALTLVTCYPFYFVGSAPQRYVVRAYPEG